MLSNEIADYCYKELKKNDEIFIYGTLDGKVRIKTISLEKAGCDLEKYVEKD